MIENSINKASGTIKTCTYKTIENNYKTNGQTYPFHLGDELLLNSHMEYIKIGERQSLN
jgi:hypothetical protein